MQQPDKPWIATSEVVYDPPLGTKMQVLSASGDISYLQAWVCGCRVVLLMRREHTVMRIVNLAMHSGDGLHYTVSRAHEGQGPLIPPRTVRNAEGEVQRHLADHWSGSTNVTHDLKRGTELEVIDVSGDIYYMELAIGCPIILLMRLEHTLIWTDELSTVVAACRPLVTAAAMPSEATQQKQKQKQLLQRCPQEVKQKQKQMLQQSHQEVKQKQKQLLQQSHQEVKQKQKQLLQRCISNATSNTTAGAAAMMPPKAEAPVVRPVFGH